MNESFNHRCWHLVDVNNNPLISNLIKNRKLECSSGDFCDHRIPATPEDISETKIDCPYEKPANCPIIIRENTKKAT